VPRVMLHARTLGFRHPITGEVCEYERPAPSDMAGLIRKLDERLDLRRMSSA
jgi:23S rRNA pseudouridine1911/1915/1917 synthase